MRRSFRLWFVVACMTLALGPAAQAGPFQNFFRKVRHALSEPEKPTRHHKMNHTSASKSSPKAGGSGATDFSQDSAVTGPPNAGNTRTAKGLSSKKPHSSDAPYGVPVPGKQGFVTSPFAPNSGYVDVRGFPPGTQVKDPYSGKTFLTP
ncbi:MAG: hypothetical protein ACJ8M1_07360 [Chthoniobacterales bacterium]